MGSPTPPLPVEVVLALLLAVAAFVLLVFPLYRDNGRLIGLARRLERPRLQRGALRLVKRVLAAWRGREVVVEPGRWTKVCVAAPPTLGPLTISARGLDTWLLAHLRRNVQHVSSLALQGEAAERLAGALERASTLERRVRAALEAAAALGGTEVELRNGWLYTQTLGTDTEGLLLVVDTLASLAEGLEDLTALTGRVREVEAAARRCPFCHDGLGDEEATPCPGCRTPHHADCWSEGGGCAIFGCGAGPVRERASAAPSTRA
ncbi:MAG: hypothetical protein KF878_35695 [Planctomycetes bacterium]|nr:hypothetical protein [Planctomycetota bacterium]